MHALSLPEDFAPPQPSATASEVAVAMVVAMDMIWSDANVAALMLGTGALLSSANPDATWTTEYSKILALHCALRERSVPSAGSSAPQSAWQPYRCHLYAWI